MLVTIERFAASDLRTGAPDNTYRWRYRVDQQPTPAATNDQGTVTVGWATTFSNACDACKAITEITGP